MKPKLDIGCLEVTRKDLKKAVATYTSALIDYPLYVAMMPERAEREKGVRLMFECFVRYTIAKGHVYATSAEFEGVMALLPPESVQIRIWDMFVNGGWKILAKLGLGFLGRQAPYSTASDRIRDEHAPAGHWLLWHIAITPAEQGKGHGARLMSALCQYLDTTGQPCYLDTNVEKNTRYYQGFGFEVVAADSNATPGLTWWGMVRPKRGD